MAVFWIILALITWSSCNYTSASILIYIDSASQRNCSPTTLKSLCNINVTEYDNSNVMLYTCPDFDSALEYITTTDTSNYDNFSYVHICLPSGNFVLNNSWSLNISFVLTGHNEVDLSQSVIQCAGYNGTQDANIVTTASDLEYTLFFKNVQFVKFEFVQFKSCPQPIRIEQSYNVSVLNCAFTNFSESVFDIYDSDLIRIMGSHFSNNTGTGSVLLPFRGNTGAVAIAYNQNQQANNNPNILVENCTFTNNQAKVSAASFQASGNSLLREIFVGTGGALGVLVNESSYNVTAVVSNSKFVRNFASGYGGAIEVIFSGYDTQHIFSMEKCQLINNIGVLGAGGIQFTSFSRSHRNFPMTLIIKRSYYSRNQGELGGAVNINLHQAEGNVVAIENSTFHNNIATDSGGAITAGTQSLFGSTEGLPKYNISDW